MKEFGGRRQDGGKVNKVRSVYTRNLEQMQKCMNVIQMVGTAAAAFPPAMPVGIVFTACGHVLSVSNSYLICRSSYNMSRLLPQPALPMTK
jgi:hypothetical protein